MIKQGNYIGFIKDTLSSFTFLHDRAQIFHDNQVYSQRPDLQNCLLATCLSVIKDEGDGSEQKQKIDMEELIKLATALKCLILLLVIWLIRDTIKLRY